MTKDEALDLALEALKKSDGFLYNWHENASDDEADAYATARQLNEKAITAIKQARSAQQEPVTIPDCGEAGHADGACGNRECLPSFRRAAALAQPAPGDIRALKHRIHELEGEVLGYKQMLDLAEEKLKSAPVQEPVVWVTAEDVKVFNTVQGESVFLFQKNGKWNVPLYTTPPAAAVQEGRDWSLLEATQESLREHMAEIKRLKEAQPAVPDAMTSADIQENIEYVAGWNECRQAMLEMMK